MPRRLGSLVLAVALALPPTATCLAQRPRLAREA
jgi:hypothetical protein